MGRSALVDNRENFALTHNDQFFTVDFDGVATSVLAKNHGITDFHGQRANLATVQNLAFTYGDDFTLVGLFVGGTRQQNTSCGGFFLCVATNDHAVVQRTNAHVSLSPNDGVMRDPEGLQSSMGVLKTLFKGELALFL